MLNYLLFVTLREFSYEIDSHIFNTPKLSNVVSRIGDDIGGLINEELGGESAGQLAYVLLRRYNLPFIWKAWLYGSLSKKCYLIALCEQMDFKLAQWENIYLRFHTQEPIDNAILFFFLFLIVKVTFLRVRLLILLIQLSIKSQT